MKKVTWIGPKEDCNFCGEKLSNKIFIDGKTTYGPWGIMCEKCFKVYGIGLGTGKGQKYDENGIKIEG